MDIVEIGSGPVFTIYGLVTDNKLKYIRFSILHLVLSEGYRAFSELLNASC